MNKVEESSPPAAAPSPLTVSGEAKSLAAEIGRRLDETAPGAIAQIERLVQYLGNDQARALLQDTLEIEAGEGLLTSNKKRRRTSGGVYLHLARSRVPQKDRRLIWPFTGTRSPKKKTKAAGPIPPPLSWQEVLALIPELFQQKGLATTVKITLVGRPGKVIEKSEVVLTSMQSGKVPSLPKGLPAPPAEPAVYVIFIARKQWQRVKESLKDPQDALIVEGFPVFDKRLNAMTVFATNTTTKLLSQAKREAQREKAE